MGMKFTAVCLLLMMGAIFTHCNHADTELSEVTFSQGDEAAASSGERSQLAFENSVYQITRQHCAGCHTTQTPVHAHPDSERAMSALIDASKVDFNNISRSRIVAKLKDENHGCWSNCEENAAEMQSMVEQWYAAIVADGTSGILGTPDGSTDCFEETITEPGADPVQAYVDTGLHQIFMNQCSTCHTSNTDRSPFGDSNAQVAFDAAYGDGSGTYLDFANPGQGRMLEQVNTGHNNNCNVGSGECATVAAEITSAVTQWSLLAAATTRVVETCNFVEEGIISTTDKISDEPVASGNQNGGEIQASQATLAGNFVLVGDYVESPNNGVGPETAPTGNSATFNFSIQDAGIYEIIAEVNGPSGSDNSFLVQMNGGTVNPFRFMPTNGFEMVKVSEGNDDNNDVFSQFTLGAGNHSVTFHLREDGTQLRKIIIQPVGAPAQNPVVTLKFDLSSLTNIPDNRLEIDFRVLDNYSYEASNVKMINGEGLLVKNLKIYVNGRFSPQHSTFTLVDKVIGSNDEQVTPYSMIVLKDKDEFQDVIGVKFGTISK